MAAGLKVLWRFQACHCCHTVWRHAVRPLCNAPCARSQPHSPSVQHGHRPANSITRHSRSTSTHSRWACTRAKGPPMGTRCYSWEYGGVTKHALLVRLLLLIFPVAEFRLSGAGVPPHGVQVVGRTVRASKQQPIQFKKLSQTIRPFICECMLDYRALECWLR